MPHLMLALMPLVSFFTSDGPTIRPVWKTPSCVMLAPTIVRGAAKKPRPDEVLKAVGLRKGADVRMALELQADYEDPPRVYPMIGQARLRHMRYKCTIHSGDGTTRFFVDHNYFCVVDK